MYVIYRLMYLSIYKYIYRRQFSIICLRVSYLPEPDHSHSRPLWSILGLETSMNEALDFERTIGDLHTKVNLDKCICSASLISNCNEVARYGMDMIMTMTHADMLKLIYIIIIIDNAVYIDAFRTTKISILTEWIWHFLLKYTFIDIYLSNIDDISLHITTLIFMKYA